jgi:diguanylate cyclase (GGDEF)-like protein
MIQLKGSFLKHKVARQFFFLFIISALLPSSVLALYSFLETTKNTNQNIKEDLRDDAKKFGLSIYERLQLADQQLQLHILELSANNDSKIYRLASGFTRLYEIESATDSTINLVINQIEQNVKLPNISSKNLAMLDAGYPILISQQITGQPTKFYLIRQASYNDNLFVGVLNNSFLWGDADTFDDSRGFCIYGNENNVYFCSQVALQAKLDSIKNNWEHATTGNADWTNNTQELYVGFWTLYLEPSFHYPKLTIAITADAKDVLESVHRLRNTFVIISILTIIAIALLTSVKIRRYLAPLEALIKGISRISNNDFSHRISVSTDDEFTQLANSFNTMSSKIHQQFTFLTTLSDIDQLILSSTSLKDIIKTTLSLANTAVESSSVRIGIIDDSKQNMIDIYSEDQNHVHGTSIHSHPISDDEMVFLIDQKTIQISPNRQLPEAAETYLHYLYDRKGGLTTVLVPILRRDALVALLIFYFETEHVQEETTVRLREFGDRFAIALEKSEWENQLYQKAHHDPLTQLPNRQLLNDRLEQALKHAARDNDTFALMFIDLDRFKNVNDSLGHTAGDEILKLVANSLLKIVRDEDTVARLGGDEFVILIASEHNVNECTSKASALSKRVLKALSAPFEIMTDGTHREIHIAASIGIAIYPTDGTHPDTLLKNSDSAMYFAKSEGRNNAQFYSEQLNQQSMKMLMIESDMHRAIEKNEFELYYQPKVDSKSGEILGAEALIRWNHPFEGLISPFDFIPIAEENGLIRQIGNWCLHQACHQNKLWQDAGLKKINISVNLSPREFQQQNLLALIQDSLEKSQLDPQYLGVEIVENIAMHNMEEAIATISTFRDLGISVSIDDYGTGFSTLSYLKKFPVNVLKIDRGFIVNLTSDPGDQAIVSSTILLAHKLGLSVVAEGVEDIKQRELLCQYGCDEIQGYYFSKPVQASKFEQFLKQGFITPE